jgi:hypothetical protein
MNVNGKRLARYLLAFFIPILMTNILWSFHDIEHYSYQQPQARWENYEPKLVPYLAVVGLVLAVVVWVGIVHLGSSILVPGVASFLMAYVAFQHPHGFREIDDVQVILFVNAFVGVIAMAGWDAFAWLVSQPIAEESRTGGKGKADSPALHMIQSKAVSSAIILAAGGLLFIPVRSSVIKQHERFQAWWDGDLESVQNLLSQGWEVDRRGRGQRTCLIVAAELGKSNTVHYLLSRKSDPNAVSNLGVSALCESAYWGHFEICRMLLEHGANPNQAESKRPSITWRYRWWTPEHRSTAGEQGRKPATDQLRWGNCDASRITDRSYKHCCLFGESIGQQQG